jgi:cell division protein FtsB
MEKILNFFKKFWWLVLMFFAFIAGLFIHRDKKNPNVELLEKQRKDLQKEEEELKKEQKKLEKEADEIAKEKPFSDADNAAKFINNILKRKQ